MATALAKRDRSLIEQAFDLAAPTPKHEGAKDELTSLLWARKTLLPVEEEARLKIEKRTAELETILAQAVFVESKLPLEPLGWRWRSGLPKLTLLSLRQPTFNITASIPRERTPISGDTQPTRASLSPALPRPLADCYMDVVDRAKNRCIRRGSSCSYTYKFRGVIPSSVRANIAVAMESNRFDELFMLVETPEKSWEVKTHKGMTNRDLWAEKMENINLDPLILGWALEALWVIDKFDLTTLEQYVLDEFSQKALPAVQNP